MCQVALVVCGNTLSNTQATIKVRVSISCDRHKAQLQAFRFFYARTTMFLNRLHRALSSFNHVTHRWAAIPLRDPHHPITQTPSYPVDAFGKQSLSPTSWNIQASQSGPVERSKLILDHILKEPKSSDIIHLQEVASSVRQSLLDDPRARSRFLTTDAEDDASFKRLPFTTMTLLSAKRFGSLLLDEGEGGGKMMLDSVFRMELPSRYRRDALCVDIAAPARNRSPPAWSQ